jgi:hypothetical protein
VKEQGQLRHHLLPWAARRAPGFHQSPVARLHVQILLHDQAKIHTCIVPGQTRTGLCHYNEFFETPGRTPKTRIDARRFDTGMLSLFGVCNCGTWANP